MKNFVSIIGSFKFKDLMFEEYNRLTEEGNLVYLPYFGKITDTNIEKIHNLQYEKMKMSDYVYVIDKNGYIGNDTQREIDFCKDNKIDLIFYSESKKPVKKQTKIFVVLGKTGVGKDSLINAFMMQQKYGMTCSPTVEKVVPYIMGDHTNSPFSNANTEYRLIDDMREIYNSNCEIKFAKKYDTYTVGFFVKHLVKDAYIISGGNFDLVYTLATDFKNRKDISIEIILIDADDKTRLLHLVEREHNQMQADYKKICNTFAEDSVNESLNPVHLSQKIMKHNLQKCNIHFIQNNCSFIEAYERFCKIILGGKG